MSNALSASSIIVAAAPADAAAAAPQPKRSAIARKLRRGGWGIGDQMLISGTNFVTMVLLARGLGPAAFGAFTLVYGGMLFANSLQGALIVQPHSVLSAHRTGSAGADYTTTTALAQLMFALAAAVLALVGGLGCWLAGWTEVATLLLMVSPCVVAWQCQEFVRRVLYDDRRFAAAFANDLISYGGQTAAIAALWWAAWLTSASALLAIAVTSFLAVGLGLWQIRARLSGRPDWQVIRENWHFGKWLAGAEIGYWTSSQAYMYLAGFMLGTSAVGVLKAAYVVFGPMRILGYFLKSVFPNRFARTLAEKGKAGLNKQVTTAYLTVAPLMGLYCLAAALLAGPLMRLMYGPAYAGNTSVLVLYAVFAFIAFMAQVVGCALKAGRLTRQVFQSQLWASIVSLPLGWVLLLVFGVEGVVVGMIVTSLVVNTCQWRAYRRDLGATAATDTDCDPDPEAAASTATVSNESSLPPEMSRQLAATQKVH